jgi:hypothetical protein
MPLKFSHHAEPIYRQHVFLYTLYLWRACHLYVVYLRCVTYVVWLMLCDLCCVTYVVWLMQPEVCIRIPLHPSRTTP